MKEKNLTARSVYDGSNGGATRSFCCQLEKKGRAGKLAAGLFRVQKASSRAKQYKGGIDTKGGKVRYRDLAYRRKEVCMAKLCELLEMDGHGMTWGWKKDPSQAHADQVLYVEIPQGQVSFHSPERYAGPEYRRDWDGAHQSEKRIIQFCDQTATSS